MSNFFGYYIDVQLNHDTIEHILNFFQPIFPLKIQQFEHGNSTCIDIIKQIDETSSEVVDGKISSRFTIKITFPSDVNMMNFISMYNRYVNQHGKMELERKSGFKFHIKIFKDGKYNDIDVN